MQRAHTQPTTTCNARARVNTLGRRRLGGPKRTGENEEDRRKRGERASRDVKHGGGTSRAGNWASKKQSIISTPVTESVGGRIDGRERRKGETVAIELCRLRYIVQLCFPPFDPLANVTNAGDIFCYDITGRLFDRR